ncbi:MAG: HD domain-containing phosphohydrolase [Acidobacteriota bacterium]
MSESSDPAPQVPPKARRLKLGQVLFLALLLSGSIPLLLNSAWLIRQNRSVLESQERVAVASSGRLLSQRVDSSLSGLRQQLTQLGAGLLAAERQGTDETLRQGWVRAYLRGLTDRRPEILALRVLDEQGGGPSFASGDLPLGVEDAFRATFRRVRSRSEVVYELVRLPGEDVPAAVLGVPILRDAAEPALVVEALIRLDALREVYGSDELDDLSADRPAGSSVFLIGSAGDILWSRGATPAMEEALARSQPVADFRDVPMALSSEYSAEIDGAGQDLLVRMSPIEEAGWALVTQRPLGRAFDSVDRMILRTALSSLVLILLAIFFGWRFSRRFGPPIERMAAATAEIADGRFDERIAVDGLSFEFEDLGRNFNRMAQGMEVYVGQLRRAAKVHRDLFIGTVKALTAAIDAKDPYTRGHSERVAQVSRIIARHLGMSDERRHAVWIGALVHDVGKIGIDDSILTKGGVLTEDEFEVMKRHPVIGAEIMAPIEQLRDAVPTIRWHHEAWNGSGYPDGLRGEEIPLEARIVCVADTFDAITTNRPYQQAYTLEFAMETITRLAGSRFDAKVVTAFLKAHKLGEIPRPGGTWDRPDSGAFAPVRAPEIWTPQDIDDADETIATIS